MGVKCASQRGGALGMTKGILITLLLKVGLSAPAAAAPRYPGDRGPGGIWNDGPHACRLGQSCNCHPDAYVAIRCKRTPNGPQCWWNNNCYCEPPMANQYCGSRSGDWPAFENARRIDAVGLRLIGDFIGMTRPSIALQVSAFRSKAGMAFCGGTLSRSL